MKWMVRWLCLVMLLMAAAPAMALEEFADATLQNATSVLANGTAMVVNRYNTITLQTTFSGTATVSFEGSQDGSTYVGVICTSIADTTSTVTISTTASSVYQCGVAGLLTFRARVSAYTSGAVTVTARATTAGGGGGGAGGGGGGGTSVTATASAPLYSEGTSNPLSSDLAGNTRMTMGTLLTCEDELNTLCRTSGGKVRATTMALAVTTDTTSASTELPTGEKTIYGKVVGTGAVTQTQAIYGGIETGFTPSTEGVLLCTLTLSGTTTAVDACPPFKAPYPFYKVVTTNTTGTSASGTVVGTY